MNNNKLKQLIRQFDLLKYGTLPYLTPLGPALISGISSYNITLIESHWSLAVIVAIVVALTVEVAGSIIAFYMLSFWKQERYLMACFMLAGMLVYTGAGMYFAYLINVGFSMLVLLALFVYVGMAGMSVEVEEQENLAAEGQQRLAEAEVQLKIQEAIKSGKLADARGLKFSAAETEIKPKKSEIYVNPKVKAYLEGFENPQDVKLYDIVEGAGVALGTASDNKRSFLSTLTTNGKSGVTE